MEKENVLSVLVKMAAIDAGGFSCLLRPAWGILRSICSLKLYFFLITLGTIQLKPYVSLTPYCCFSGTLHFYELKLRNFLRQYCL